MDAPLTGNSITERVVYNGQDIPEPTWNAGVADASSNAQDTSHTELQAAVAD